MKQCKKAQGESQQTTYWLNVCRQAYGEPGKEELKWWHMKKAMKKAVAVFMVSLLLLGNRLSAAAGEIGELTSTIALQTVSVITKPVSLNLESGVLDYCDYGKWKQNVPLYLEVDGVRTVLPKDGSSVNIGFKNGDKVRLLVGESVELSSGTVKLTETSDGNVIMSIDKTGISFDEWKWKCYVTYDISDGIKISAEWSLIANVGSGFSDYDSFYYDLTAKTKDGEALSGISFTDENVYIPRDVNLAGYEYEKTNTWGDGNSLYYCSNGLEEYEGILVKVTDEKGYADMTVPVEDTYSRICSKAGYFFSGYKIARKIFVNNGLVEIDTVNGYRNSETGEIVPYYQTMENLQLSTNVKPMTDEILGDYYRAIAIETEEDESARVLLKDETGKEIATVELKAKNPKGDLQDNYCFEGDGNELEYSFEPDVNVVMAEGMGNWRISVILEGTTFHINAVKGEYGEYMIGDINGDSAITAEDALAILKHVVGLEMLTGDALTCADVNADNGITAEDALDVLKKVVGLLDKFKAEAEA